ncbi:hypothetical protein AAGS30_01770 [Shewanella sp. VAX-SP4-0CM-7]
MAKKINISQLQSKLRQIESNQRQAINKYNQEVRKHNQNIKNAVNKYNSAVRQHNARVRANRQRIINELNRLQSRTTVRYQVLHTSTVSLNRSYQSLERHEQEFENIPFGNQFLDLSEKENANSLAVSNAMESDEPQTNAGNDGDLISTYITGELIEISLDLDSRWKGALFSLSPMNPDASRHFCTSAREYLYKFLITLLPIPTFLPAFHNVKKQIKDSLLDAGKSNTFW